MRSSHSPSFRRRRAPFAGLATVAALAAPAHAGGFNPWGDGVVEFDPGLGGIEGYDDPFTTLGSPERFTGEGIFPAVVSPFSPPYGTDEILSIGPGGHLTVSFDQPVVDDAFNPFGVDLLIFGNAGFIDDAYPAGVVGGFFGAGGGVVEVSADGKNWVTVLGAVADGLFPTLGYLDAGPYDEVPGSVPSDFTRPVDPALDLTDFIGLEYPDLLALYGGSGGGSGIDLASVGLAEISFLRVSNPTSSELNVEIDAFSDVAPIPAPGALAGLAAAGLFGRRRRHAG